MSSALKVVASLEVGRAPIRARQGMTALSWRLRVLAALPALYVLLHAGLFGAARVAVEGLVGLSPVDAYVATTVLLAGAAAALAALVATWTSDLRSRPLVSGVLVLHGVALVAAILALGPPWSAPLTAIPAVGIGLLVLAWSIRRVQVSTAVVLAAAVAAVLWLGQSPCSGVTCRSSGTPGVGSRLPALVVEGHGGYNVVEFGAHYYAIPQSGGPFDVYRYYAGGYASGADGASLAGVLNQLDGTAGGQPRATAGDSEARGSGLVMAGYLSSRFGNAYDVYRSGDRFYAIRAVDGAFDGDRYRAGGYADAFDGASLDEVVQQLAGGAVLAGPLEPVERYRGYVVFELDRIFYAVVEDPEDEKAFSLERFWRGEYPGALDGSSLEQVRERIDARFAPATLIYGGYHGYDIWDWGGRVYGIPEQYGGFEIARYERGEYAGAVEGASIPEAIEAVDESAAGARTEGAGN